LSPDFSSEVSNQTVISESFWLVKFFLVAIKNSRLNENASITFGDFAKITVDAD
jgi:hypothetical protein